ncbi:hypothetical protein HYDPIDRAFT_115700 [Hydnomerulius pinastri MD-312]|uniref:Uncharacterized protein n=1 Tax=Hydnomerulius pinastri MD-312 TaxID=994086 RepID=A0A0C9W4U3_9AGAM|nr:hypothetical protein HYDPIDRAFT_115700 [Hydnomerulius pinastri MD-312]
MAMDRKNKKAAQLAANGGVAGGGSGGGGGREGRGSKGGKRELHPAPHGHGGSSAGAPANTRTGLLSGSTAPTRVTSTRPPISMSLKATISPSAPAPPLKDTDFTAFVLPDDVDSQKTSTTTAASTNPETPASGSTKQDTDHDRRDEAADTSTPDPSTDPSSSNKPKNSSPPTLPLSVPSAPRRPVLPSDAMDLGPIGSPPQGSLPTHSPLSTGTPPQGAGVPSTFHAQTSLLTESRNRLGAGTGPSSLGHTHTQAWKTELGPVPSQVLTSSSGPGIGVNITGIDRDRDGATDEDLEEFLPSSLTDLLTPSERSRRMSRTHSGSSRPVNFNDAPSPHSTLHPHLAPNPSHHAHHRYSRSVPAPSLLGDVKSIWAERGTANNGLPGSPDTHTFGLGAIGSGTPSSLKSTNGFGGLGATLGTTATASGMGTSPFRDDTHSPSPSLLAPSNASAAFLPSLHHYYSKMNTGNNGRGPSAVNSNAGLGLGAGLGGLSGLSRSPLSHTPLHGPAADEGRSGAGVGLGMGPGPGEATSPSIRALQAHAPGQSLPQGLAAGYSRIHAMPLTGSPGSLGTSGAGGGAFSPGQGQVPFGINAGSGLGQDWFSHQNHSHLLTEEMSHLSLSSHHDVNLSLNPPLPSSMAGFESTFSRLTPTSSPLRTPPHSTANSNRNWHHTQGALSPLRRPVATADDDDLFSME